MAESRRGEYSSGVADTVGRGSIEGGDCDSHREVAAAAAAKKQAKKLSKNVPGSSQTLRGGVFVERRRVGAGGTAAAAPAELIRSVKALAPDPRLNAARWPRGSRRASLARASGPDPADAGKNCD